MTPTTQIRTVLLMFLMLFGLISGWMPAMAKGQQIKFKVMRDVESSVGISTIANLPVSAFEAESHTSVRSNYGERSLWLRLVNIRSTEVLQLRPVLDKATLFVRLESTSGWQEFQTGDQIAQSERSILSPFMALPIPIGADRDVMYLRVVQPTSVSIKLRGWTRNDFTKMETNDKYIKLFLFGFVFAAIALNIFVSSLLRDPIFLYNSMTIASLLLFSLYLSGYGVAYFWNDWTGWSNNILVISIYSVIVFGGVFMWQFLRSKSDTIGHGWPIIYSPILVTFIVILWPVLPFWVVLLSTLIAGALLLLSTIIFVCVRAWVGDPKARIMIFPLLFAVIPGLTLVTMDRIFGIGVFPYSHNTLEITLCIEALLFSLALVARVRISELAIRAANEDVLRMKYETSVKTVEAQDNERKRLAKELHDGVGQNFLSVVGSLKSLAVRPDIGDASKSLLNIINIATDSLNELRRISKDMHPSSIEHLGLKRAIELLFENLEVSDQIVTEVDSQFNEAYLTPNMELNVYRIFQECLSNISRHADATCCRAAIVSRNGQLEAYIEDDGTGMKHDGEMTIGLGLISIEERIQALKGQYRLSKSAEGGAKIEFSFPITSTTKQERYS